MAKATTFPINRQAVIVIHGIGEQRPMDTLREFVEAVAPPNQDRSKPPYFSHPDHLSESFELRRLTAHRQRNTFTTDYFEFYWAHLITGTQPGDVLWWIRNMFIRWPQHIPQRLRWLFYAFWGVTIVALGLLALIAYRSDTMLPAAWQSVFTKQWFKTITSTIITVISVMVNGILLSYLGDAIRYFTPRPRNVPEREQIRKAGVGLLRKLHDAQDEHGKHRYDRIMVVGHSLGSVIAYDIVCLYWNEFSPKLMLNPADIDKAEATASDFRTGKLNLDAYRQAQFDFWQAQYRDPQSWRISDLITAGSPLAFADLHLADGAEKLKIKQNQREFPTCPPRTEPPTAKQLEKLKNKNRLAWFSFPASDDGSVRMLHHAAPFAMTRWTNLSFKNDFVGGNITCFDEGVENRQFTAKSYDTLFGHRLLGRWRLPFQSHTHYWDKEETESLQYLQTKLQLIFKSAVPEIQPEKDDETA